MTLSLLDPHECWILAGNGKDKVSPNLKQTVERIQLLRAWCEPDESTGYQGLELGGKQILEVGCGQGDCTVVLGRALQLAKNGGKLYAVDPGR